MSDFKVGAKKAILAVEHLLYEITEYDLNNVAANLAQERKQPVDNYCSAAGFWTFDVVQQFLFMRGIKCTPAGLDNKWLLDAPGFLCKNPALVGFIDATTLETFKWGGKNWLAQKGPCLVLPKQQLFAVHKMWIPLVRFYEKPFFITTDDDPWVRHECQPSSCWRVEPVDYSGRQNAVKQQMRVHKKSPILMSNNKEFLLCQPGKNGWKTETILNYACLDIKDASKQISEQLSTILVDHIETLEPAYAWSVMAHALFSALQHLGGRLDASRFGPFTIEEIKLLEEYEAGFLNTIDTSYKGEDK